MQQAVQELAPQLGVARACLLLGLPRSSYYRASASASRPASEPAALELSLAPSSTLPDEPANQPAPTHSRGRAVRGLSAQERERVLAVLNSERFADLAPREVYATLLDEGVYLCSWSTMYRLLRQVRATTRRRDQRRAGSSTKPELLATAPRQLWSWDITKLKGPSTWTYF